VAEKNYTLEVGTDHQKILRYWTEYTFCASLCLTPRAEGFPWDDLRKIFSGCQWMAKAPNAVEIFPKISTA